MVRKALNYGTEAEIQLPLNVGFQIPDVDLPQSQLVGVEGHPTTKKSLQLSLG